MISGEYGWSDDQILDLLPVRLHRIAQAIQLRQEADFRRGARLQAGATRAIVAAIHGAQGHKKGVERAQKLELLEPEPTVDAVAEQITPAREVSAEQVVAMWGPPAWGAEKE